MTGNPFPSDDSNNTRKDEKPLFTNKQWRIIFGIVGIVTVGSMIYHIPDNTQAYLKHIDELHAHIDNMTCPQLYHYAYVEYCGIRTGCLQEEEWGYANYTFYSKCDLVKSK